MLFGVAAIAGFGFYVLYMLNPDREIEKDDE
jgi:hypothetical protein